MATFQPAGMFAPGIIVTPGEGFPLLTLALMT